MDKGTQNALLYTAGLAAVYLGYKYYKKQQGLAQQTPVVNPATPAPSKVTPSGPTFSGASAAYIKNIKTLQTLLGVKADGIIGPITTKAAIAAGINYKINATNIDKAIATAQAYKAKPTVTFPWWTTK
jgi:murein L,D-transpeptidase YcbB/YkuD